MKFPALSSPAILGPMAGVTDVAFRALCKRYGAGMTYTEFVSSAALVRGSKRTAKMLDVDPSERPVGVQLFGNSEEEVIAAAKHVAEQFDVIDINCGCPAWKVIKIGAGSALMSDPRFIANLVHKIVSVIDKPITVKIRAGVDADNINAVEVAKEVESVGAAAVAVHGRTAAQGYSGEPDWNLIKEVKQAIKIPVIGNGDVFSPETFKQRLEESGVDAIMVARGAIGNPYIFRQINDYLKTGTYDSKDKIEQLQEYLDLAKEHNLSFSQVKAQAISFTKGLERGARLREQLGGAKGLADVENAFSHVIRRNIRAR